ncbi:Uncharacterised protein [uncultured archaeon]|nr:Uncharacterised protein [uncultured archaeon]
MPRTRCGRFGFLLITSFSDLAILLYNFKEKTKWHDAHNILIGGMVTDYGFILCFRTQVELNSAYELVKKKSSHFTLRKFFNPANVPRRFTLVIECREQDIVESLENYFLRFYSGDVDISLLCGHESEIDKMMPI